MMKQYFLVAALLTFGFQGYTQTLINQFPAPTNSCGDLAFDGEYLWIGGQDEYELFQISTVDGQVIRTIPSSARSPYGLTFDNTHLWVADTENEIIRKIDTLNGDVISVFPSPKSDPSNLTGFAWDGNEIWINDFGDFNGGFENYENDSTFVIDIDGNTIENYQSIGQGPTGLGYGNGFLFSADSHTDQIYIIDPNSYSVLDSFPTYGGTHPNGITWDGNYLWIANNDVDSIYQVDIGSIITSLPEVQNVEMEVSIYPNPTVDYINLEFNTSNLPIIQMVDLKGRLVLPRIRSNSNTFYSLDVSSLESGYYLLSIIGDETKTSRLILKE
ncbi:MAG: T9SS type A sorting domain-containing protein [Flavobacteriales bacterium]